MTAQNDLNIQVNLSQLLRPVQWVALGLGFLLLILGLQGNHNLAIAGCFFGIVARIAQAEHHHGEVLRRTSSNSA